MVLKVGGHFGWTLPATGLTLSEQLVGSQVQLQWTTQTESNTKHFVIERSEDGVRYTSIGEVKTVGNSTSLRSYRFTDVTAQMAASA